MAGSAYVTEHSLGESTERWLAALAPFSRHRPLPALRHAALLVLDLQRYFADAESHAHLPALHAVLPNIERLVHGFHRAGLPVVLTRHGATAPSLMSSWWGDEPCAGEPRAELMAAAAGWPAWRVMDKPHYSAFVDTDLAAWLRQRGCDTVVLTGVMTHLCCETTARDAFMRQLQPVVVADGCATQHEELHLGALRGLAHGFAVVSRTEQLLHQLRPTTDETTAPATDVTAAATTAGPRCTSRPLPLPRRCELAVVGAGPAGLAAAIQAQREGLEPCLLDASGQMGGQATTANWIENYPGFPGGISGQRLMARFAAQAAGLALRVHGARVHALQPAATGELRLELEPLGPERAREQLPARALQARAVILASGSAPRALPRSLPPDAPLAHRVDRAGAVRGNRWLVLGGGEAALDQALLLRRRGARQVTVLHRGSQLSAMPRLVQQAEQQGVELRYGHELAALAPAPGGWTARLLPRGELAVDGVLVCIGKRPELPRLPAAVTPGPAGPERDSLGRTAVPGLYVVGDASRGRYRQISIAVGDGVAAAMHAARYLRTGSWEEAS